MSAPACSVTVADGCRIAYRVDGPGAAPGAVLLLGGLGDDSTLWDAEAAALAARGGTVLRLDNRGAGASELGPDDLSITRMADDATAVLDALGIDRVHVVGTSMGGLIAQQLAVRHPARVRSLALVATAPRLPAGTRLLLGLWARLAASGPAGHADALLDACLHGFSPAWLDRHADRIEAWTAVDGAAGAAAFAAQIGAMLAHEPVAGLPDVPTLVLHGRDDQVMPLAVARDFAALGDRVAFEVLETGHAIAIEDPARFLDALVRFLGEGESNDG